MSDIYDLGVPIFMIIAIMITNNPYTYIWVDLGIDSSLKGQMGNVTRFEYLTKKEASQKIIQDVFKCIKTPKQI